MTNQSALANTATTTWVVLEPESLDVLGHESGCVLLLQHEALHFAHVLWHQLIELALCKVLSVPDMATSTASWL